jgi:hypothetical protein
MKHYVYYPVYVSAVKQNLSILTSQYYETGHHVPKSIFRLLQETNNNSHNHIFFNTTVRPSNLPIYTTLRYYV